MAASSGSAGFSLLALRWRLLGNRAQCLGALLEILLLMLQVPQVEHFAPVDQPLAADHLDNLLGQRQSGNRGFVLLQQGALLERLERR